MSKIVGDIAVEVSADIAPLQRGMRQARGDVNRFGRNVEQMARRAARMSAVITGAFVAASAAGVALANRVGEVGESLTNLSRVAGTTPEKFQEMAVATRSVGVEQEKLADILKDVQDRVGDFLQTGGGPMADFFENIAPKVGVTAEQFAKLSGPEALQLYVSSLERANLTQNEMTFYLEAMSSDLTAMLPLLRDNGREMNRLGKEARDAGAIISNEAVKGAADLQEKLRGMRNEIDAHLIDAMVDLEDELVALADFVADYGVPAFKKLVEWASAAAEGVNIVASAMRVMNDLDGMTPADPNREYPIPDNERTPGNEPNSNTGTYDYTDPFFSQGLNGQGRPNSPSMRRPRARPEDLNTGRGSSRRGGSSSGPTEEDFERLRDQFATEQEIIQENYERQLEQLEEFRNRKLATEEEYNELEKRIHKDHQDKMLALEKARRAATLNAISGALGDVASLMQSENKKAFQIGKAAAIADATIKGYQAAVAAWEKGMSTPGGGPHLAAAFAAASVAKTGMLISQIASTQYGGGGGGGAGAVGGGGAAAAGGAAQTPQVSRDVVVQLTGGPMFTREQVAEFLTELNEYVEDGGNIRVV
ncbi:hypothetical protein [Roseovarius indicus]|uniref:Tail tape measure protein n=1 Tax=Roseovarius indicus TaxID=540747 RepID=A0A5P3ACL3_9RHOB|nr:hypothetical protein [Roseovarius indicus]QEW26931.1 hypothetical protein RIdsm_02739 [Roseovarius indicus]SFD57604.1 hypothetical protein SAMN04488031_101605 [Roseovarius indicus]